MAWIETTFAYGSILTSTKMTNMYNNFTALASQESGAPEIWSSYKGMHGFNIDPVTNVDSAIYAKTLKVQQGRCLAADGNSVIYFDTELSKHISSGSPYSFGDSGGAVPSSLTSIWPDVSSLPSQTWYHIFIMKNTTNGSMDWGIDIDIDSATNLLIEVNSVNGGGWDSFRRLGSVHVYDTEKITDFYKRGHLFQRNNGLTATVSLSNITSWHIYPKAGPSATQCWVSVEKKGSDRDDGDQLYVKPYDEVSSWSGLAGLFGLGMSVRHAGDSVLLMCNSGNLACKASSAFVPNEAFILNWWYDPFEK